MKTILISFASRANELFFTFFAAICAFLLPVQTLLLTVGGAIALDTLCGLARAKKKKEQITSRKLSQVVSKMFLYESAIILFFCMEKYILTDFIVAFTSIPLFLTKIVAIVLISIEVKSINENYTQITGVNIWDRFKLLLKRGKEIKGEINELTKS